MGSWLKLKAGDGHELAAYEARPEQTAKGGLVVIQEIFGVNAHIRSVVDRFAGEGYHAIAPALFDRIQPGTELRYEGEDIQRGYGMRMQLQDKDALADIAAAFHHVEGTCGAATVGYCYGGFMSWLAATRGPEAGFAPKCTIGYYAGGIGGVATEEPTCPVMLNFGAKDTHIGPEQIDAVRQAHPEVTIYIYEGADHGFNCDGRASFDPEASSLASQRTLAFLSQYLG